MEPVRRRHSEPEEGDSEPEECVSEPEEGVSEPEEPVSEKMIKKHLAGRYNVKAKWEKLLAGKEARVSWFETTKHSSFDVIWHTVKT